MVETCLLTASRHARLSFKGTVMKIEKALINDCLRVSKVSLKFRVPTFHNFAVTYP